MSEWDDPKYTRLLSPSILNIQLDKIKKSIRLAEKFNINTFITIHFIRKPLNHVYAIAIYLNDKKFL